MSLLNPFSKDKEGSKSQVEPKTSKDSSKPTEEDLDKNPDNKPKPVESSEENKHEISKMKRGDYMIHIYVEQAKNIKVDAEETRDPLVQINCLG
jgi:hypothetical protein